MPDLILLVSRIYAKILGCVGMVIEEVTYCSLCPKIEVFIGYV
jgi:hypothetical protein